MLISCAVTAQLMCVFVFAYADCLFSHVGLIFIVSSETKKKLRNFCFKNAICLRYGTVSIDINIKSTIVSAKVKTMIIDYKILLAAKN